MSCEKSLRRLWAKAWPGKVSPVRTAREVFTLTMGTRYSVNIQNTSRSRIRIVISSFTQLAAQKSGTTRYRGSSQKKLNTTASGNWIL